jgi:hypothetical protein
MAKGPGLLGFGFGQAQVAGVRGVPLGDGVHPDGLHLHLRLGLAQRAGDRWS